MNNETLYVLVDSRETQHRKNLALRYWNTSIKELPVGDYIYKDTVIEYKTCEDFLSSIRDKRLKIESINQFHEFKYHYVLIEGDIDETLLNLRYKNVNFTKNEYNGALSSLLTYTKVIPASNENHAFELMNKIFKKLHDGKDRTVLPVPKPSSNPVYNYIGGVYKVGDTRAKLICDELGLSKLTDLLQITKKDLLTIDGIGETTANRIMEAIK